MPLRYLLVVAAGFAFSQTPPPKPAAAPKPKPVAPAAAAKPKPAPTAAAKPKPAPAAAAKPKPSAAEPAVIAAGDEKMSKTEFEAIISFLTGRTQQDLSNAEGRKRMATQLGEMFAMASEARKAKIDQDPKVQQQLRLQMLQILANAYVERLAQGPSDEAALRKYYDEHKREYEQVAGRHILIRFQGSRVPVREGQKDLTEAESLAKAQEVIKRIAGGEDFGEVAKKESDDTGSGANGGSLGTFGRGQMVPEFETAAFSLPVGKVSEPVKSQFGYHVIQIQEQKNSSFEEARTMIEQRQKPERAKQIVDDVKKRVPVVLDEAYFAK